MTHNCFSPKVSKAQESCGEEHDASGVVIMQSEGRVVNLDLVRRSGLEIGCEANKRRIEVDHNLCPI